jgi:hypothetical protein
VYLSTNNGTSWAQTSLNNRSILALAVNGNNIIAGSYSFSSFYGVYLSTSNGTSWTQTSLNNQNVSSLAVNGNNIFAGSVDNGVYVSNNNGASWIERNENLAALSINALCILDNYIFAGTYGGVYRRPLSELIGIQPISNEFPTQFSLSQNFPNPFNPTTRIRFAIPANVKGETSNTKIIIFDILGREVKTLVNEQLKAGTYEVDWNASGYPSGVYFYRLETDDFTETKKMLLVK